MNFQQYRHVSDPRGIGMVHDRPDIEAERKTLDNEGDMGFPTLFSNLMGVAWGAFDEMAQKFLEQFRIVDFTTDSGGSLIRPAHSRDYGMEVSGDGVRIVGMTDEEILGTEPGLDSLLESALLSKLTPGAENGIYTYHENPQIQQAMNKAAELVGSNVRNKHAAGSPLDEANPVLARQMEEAWERVKARNGLPGAQPSIPPQPEKPLLEAGLDTEKHKMPGTQTIAPV